MAFPVVAASNQTIGTTSASGLAINLPSGVTAGDLLLAFAANDTSVSWSATGTWTQIDNGANGTAVQGAIWARIATGDSNDNLTITGEANDIAVVAVRVTGHGVSDVSTDIKVGTAATGSSAGPNPPSLNAGSSAEWLWIAAFAADDDDNTGTWWPTNYTAIRQAESAQSTSSCMVGVAYREVEASTEDPGTFAMAAKEEWRAQTIAIPPAAAADVVIEPPAGSLSLTGYAPTVEATDLPRLYYVIYASAGSEPSAAQIKAGQDATGSAATASGDEVARDTTGEQVFATAASGLSASTGYKVSLVWSDGANNSNVTTSAEFTTLGAGTTVSVPAASLSLAGQTPTVVATANVWIDIPAGSLTLTGFAPTVAPTAHVWVEPPSGSLALAAYAPTVATTANVAVEVPAASLSAAGYAPTVARTEHVWIESPAASLTLSGQTPSIAATANLWIDVPAASLTLAAQTPTVDVSANVTVQVPIASLTLAGQTPDVVATANVWIEAPTASLSVQGHAPSVLAGASVAVDVPSASLALAGFAPTVDATADVWIAVPVAGLTVSAQTPIVAASANVWIDVPSAAIGATAYAPSVLAGGDAAIQVPAAALAIAGFAPTVIAGETVVRKRGGGGVTVRLAGELRWFRDLDELYAALDEFEEVSEDRAKRKAEIVAKEQPKASPKRIAKRAPRVQVVESEIDLGPVMARVEQANRRVRDLYESEARFAMISRYMELEIAARQMDDDAAIVALSI